METIECLVKMNKLCHSYDRYDYNCDYRVEQWAKGNKAKPVKNEVLKTNKNENEKVTK